MPATPAIVSSMKIGGGSMNATIGFCGRQPFVEGAVR
jgi:hypothetical protein